MVCRGHLHLPNDGNYSALTVVSMQLCWPFSPQEMDFCCPSPHSCTGSAVEDTQWETFQLQNKNLSVTSGWHLGEQLRHNCTYKPSPSLQGQLNSLNWLYLPVPFAYLAVSCRALHFILPVKRNKLEYISLQHGNRFCSPLYHCKSVYTSWNILVSDTWKTPNILLFILQHRCFSIR